LLQYSDNMRNFRISIDIAAPSARVWEVMSDTERWHEWTPSVTSIQRRDSGPFAVGSRLVIRQPKFPPALWKVTAIEPGRSFTSTSIGPGFRVIAHHLVEPTASGSKATLSLELRGPLGGVFGRTTKGITERYIALEATGLKARSENPSFHHSGTQPDG
jgi:carbon monoxide dehydrogenase subunit G